MGDGLPFGRNEPGLCSRRNFIVNSSLHISMLYESYNFVQNNLRT